MIGKPHLSWAGTMGAGDGNRTRMTSMEGFECGGAEAACAQVRSCGHLSVSNRESLWFAVRLGT
jgi:hypothetical protein